jgi:hypothetical protein
LPGLPAADCTLPTSRGAICTSMARGLGPTQGGRDSHGVLRTRLPGRSPR